MALFCRALILCIFLTAPLAHAEPEKKNPTALFLEKDQRVRMLKITELRDRMDFTSDAQVRKVRVPAGSELRVLQLKRFSSGNYGVKVEYQAGGKLQSGWMYYQPFKPELEVLKNPDRPPPLHIAAADPADFNLLPPKIGMQANSIPEKAEVSDPVQASLIKISQLSAQIQGNPPRARIPLEKFRGYVIAESEAPFAPRQSAEKCSSRNIRDRFGDVRNQDGMGWCFAYASADLLSFYTGKSPSPFELSLRYFQREEIDAAAAKSMAAGAGPSKVAGGNLGNAISLALAEGICLERDVPSTDFLQSYLAGMDSKNPIREELQGLERRERIDWLANVVQKIEKFQESQRGDLLANPSLSCSAALSANLLFPKLGMDEILAVLKSGRSKAEIFNWLAHLSCPKKEELPRNLKIAGSVVLGPNRGASFLATVDEMMDKGEPVAITYNIAPFYKDPSGEGPNGSGLHMNLVVGREFRDGKCQYLVRNTWGPSCAGYQRPCERGHFWMSESDFNAHVEQIEYLKRQ